MMNYLTCTCQEVIPDGKVATRPGLPRRQHSGERGSTGLQDEFVFTMQELGITLPSDGPSENFRDSEAGAGTHADEVS